MSRRVVYPPDEDKPIVKRLEFMAEEKVHSAFHQFKHKYGHSNLGEALKHLLNVAEKNPSLVSQFKIM